jgi:hypothetical protein
MVRRDDALTGGMRQLLPDGGSYAGGLDGIGRFAADPPGGRPDPFLNPIGRV